MKLILTIIAVFAFNNLWASDWSSQEQSLQNQEIYEMVADGRIDFQEFSIEDQIVIANSAFYFCKAVPGGWRRCSKRKPNSCFGATFSLKRSCEDVLNGDD